MLISGGLIQNFVRDLICVNDVLDVKKSWRTTALTDRGTDRSYPSHFVLRGGAGVDEGLGDDREDGVDAVGHLDVQDELRVLQDVHPESEREAGDRQSGHEDGRLTRRVVHHTIRLVSYLLVFQMWTVSGSSMPCFSAMSSRKSKKNRTAIGGGRFVLRMATKTSSTNFCSVPYSGRQRYVAAFYWSGQVQHLKSL